MTHHPMSHFYRNEYPDVDDLILVRIERVTEMGAYASMLEYGNKEALIGFSELSRKRMRSIGKMVHPGQKHIVSVLGVDAERGYVDLSKRRVRQEEIEGFRERYRRAKRVYLVMKDLGDQANEQIAWPLYDRFGDAFEGLARAHADPGVLDVLALSPDLRLALEKRIETTFAPKRVTLRMAVGVTCFGPAGIDGIKAALRPEPPVRATVHSAPVYILEIQDAVDVGEAHRLLMQACNQARQIIETYEGGALEICHPPQEAAVLEDKMTQEAIERQRNNKRKEFAFFDDQ